MSDGCTLFPEGAWTPCCDSHDAVYKSTRSWIKRWRADIDLYKCVRNGGRPVLAVIMLVGVILLGPLYGVTLNLTQPKRVIWHLIQKISLRR